MLCLSPDRERVDFSNLTAFCAKMLLIHADPREGLASELMARVKPKIEQALGVDLEQKYGKPVAPEDWDAATVPVVNNDRLPLAGLPGYSMAWGGELEDSARAGALLAGSIPIYFGLMILIVIVLFNSIKKTLIIWLCVTPTSGLRLCSETC